MTAKKSTKPATTQAQIDAPTAMPVAISYVRFSTTEQRKGDSLRRQTADTAAWCEKNGIPLDMSLSCRDAGRSAYHGKHRSDKAALGGFLELVREGKIPRGSFLVIENLDRLSREDERTAMRLWLDILDAGVNIVQLHPETVFRHERSDMTDIVRAIIELSRGHSESRMKSVRTMANWEKAVKLAREGKAIRRKDGAVEKVITRRLPSWVTVKDGVPELIPERAAVVRRIFEMTAAGYGVNAIVKKLTKEGVSAFGECDRETDEDGVVRKRKKGSTYGCGEWRTSYIRDILGGVNDRRAIGEFQPRRTDGTKNGEPIPGYYPAVVTETEWYAARSAMGERTNRGAVKGSETNRQGRIGEGVANLFSGLLRDARDGDTYYAAVCVENGVKSRVLLNRGSIERGANAATFPYKTFESAILSCLQELKPDEVLCERSEGSDDAETMRKELGWVRGKKVELTGELLKGDSASVAGVLRNLEKREAELVALLEEAEGEAAAPLSDTWRNAKLLAELLERVPEDEREDLRLRLRSALRRMISGIWLLVVPRGRDRLCAVQVYFQNGRLPRNYIIVRRRPQVNVGQLRRDGTRSETKRSPGVWAVASALGWGVGGDLRLRVSGVDEDGIGVSGADDVAESLRNYPQDLIERMLANGRPTPESSLVQD